MRVSILGIQEKPDFGMTKYKITLEAVCFNKRHKQIREGAYEEFHDELELIRQNGAELLAKVKE